MPERPFPPGRARDENDPPVSRVDRPGIGSRVLLVVAISTALLFAGLFFHQKRLVVQQAGTIAVSDQRCAAEAAQARRWETLVFQRQKELRRANALVGFMADPSTLHCPLRGKDASGQVFVAADTSRLALFAFGLPEPGEGARYQAWSRLGSDVSSIGVLSADAEGVRTLFAALPAASTRLIYVSLETGEATAPPGEIVLQGECLPRNDTPPGHDPVFTR